MKQDTQEMIREIMEGMAYIIDRVRHSEAITRLPDCNDCRKRQTGCQWVPRPGEFVRINCPHWEGIPEDESRTC